ncbi:hypothetical protein ACS8E2_05455 [Psychrobacter glaciei]|uniref:hypothetical protein n=1 Tax=Psychrobacter glaciei TaxID=619771 RepID=UPI003F465117
MVKKLKNDDQLTCHMPAAYVAAIQNLSLKADMSASEWLREAAIEKLNSQLLQAKNVLAALESIENHKLYESYQIAEGFDDE